MSLRDANVPLMSPPRLPDGPPYPCAGLRGWVGLDWEVPPTDPRLRRVAAGAVEPSPAFANLVGDHRAWADHPRVMDFLDPASPIHAQKLLERDLYLRWWADQLPPGARVLDLGGGIGRFTQWCLDRGCDVELVDASAAALRCALDHAAGRPGRLDLHWATAEELPELDPVDVVLAVELFNYVEDPARALANVRRVLRPGGALLLSVEARWGWALAPDAPPGALGVFLDGGPLHVPGDRWVRLYTEDDVRALLDGWTVELLLPTHYALSGPFEALAGVGDVDALLAAEASLRMHPIARPLHRAWTVIAR